MSDDILVPSFIVNLAELRDSFLYLSPEWLKGVSTLGLIKNRDN